MITLLGLNNTPDALWYRFKPEDATLDFLQNLFKVEIPYMREQPRTYAELTVRGDAYALRDDEQLLAYMIFTPAAAHVVLRKARNWRPVHEQISQECAFSADV